MSSRPLLSAGSEADEATRLRREIAGLEQELQDAKNEAVKAKQGASDAAQAIRALRAQLEPLHKALKMIFGEISRVDAEQVSQAGGNPSGLSPRWEMLKKRLGARQSEIIDVLQHGPMTSAQMSAALHWDVRTTQKHISAMKVAGYLSKNGNQFSLRES
ncbi:MAG TPA: hypothetical protein VN976_22035 [Verrucomicrobiae bacterium]|nr:hypothetical protein [Verrucomicrobiae bacterium]